MLPTLAVISLVVGYLVGRLQPWDALDAWAENEVRFYGPWVRGNKAQQAVVLITHCFTHPRHSWRSLRKSR
jgi:hypothetical protein